MLVGAAALACGGTSQDGLFDNGTATSGSGGFAGAGGDGAMGGAGGSSAGGLVGTAGFQSAGGMNAAGGFTSVGGGLTAGGAPAAGGAAGAGGGRAGSGAGGFVDVGSGGAASGGVPQQLPDAGSAGAGGGPPLLCGTGHYKSKMSGPYTSITGTKEIGASIDFTVGDTGTVTGTFAGPGNAKATISGAVDCSTGVLAANIVGGTYPVGALTVKFNGTLAAAYDTGLSGFVGGTWTIKEPATARNGGSGTWP